MVLTLFSINDSLCAAWENEFKDYPNVKILCTDVRKLPPHQYLVTAGNSYAIMNGGIDEVIRNMFGVEIQDRIQWRIVRDYEGCLPVGHCIDVKTYHPDFPFLIYAPTMTVPMRIPPSNVFDTMSVVLRHYHRVDSIACCGLGAHTGGLSPDVVAKTMREAYDLIIKK